MTWEQDSKLAPNFPEPRRRNPAQRKQVANSHVGTIRVCFHREVEGKIKTLSLKREADKWFVVLACEVPAPVNVANVLPAIGLDVGLTQFVTRYGDLGPYC